MQWKEYVNKDAASEIILSHCASVSRIAILANPLIFDANIPFYKVHSIVVEAKSPLKLQFGF